MGFPTEIKVSSIFEQIVRKTIQDGLPFHVDINIFRVHDLYTTQVDARMEYQHATHSISFRISDEEAQNKLVVVKSKAARKHLERVYARCLSSSFSFDVDLDMQKVIDDVVDELRK